MLGVMPNMGTTAVSGLCDQISCPGVVTLDTFCSGVRDITLELGTVGGKGVKPGGPGGLLGTILSGFD